MSIESESLLVQNPACDSVDVATVVPQLVAPDVTLKIRQPVDGRTYEIVCISVYKTDLAELDSAVERMQAAGLKKMSRSQLLRIAFKRLDVAAVIADMQSLR